MRGRKRNTESREKAIAELVATGATAIYDDHSVVLKALNNMAKIALAGHATKISRRKFRRKGKKYGIIYA